MVAAAVSCTGTGWVDGAAAAGRASAGTSVAGAFAGSRCFRFGLPSYFAKTNGDAVAPTGFFFDGVANVSLSSRRILIATSRGVPLSRFASVNDMNSSRVTRPSCEPTFAELCLYTHTNIGKRTKESILLSPQRPYAHPVCIRAAECGSRLLFVVRLIEARFAQLRRQRLIRRNLLVDADVT